ncbi:uncharacterized protein LOC129599057 isoform X1 [Paramacrobiotus metropolitanus]|uniref:uncharacterized protein LOC129599057 isoform X1 n=1 Tax=Paramacrobiotus metropolitanus TaxID=2943436 RepID=UPI0024462686|nr:uncharacterized protein LOC129599057 isoform X1 [Paramacrobiotus metropolitanus]XP_055353163.1 uncharacterized protein LOC129599057 isoform X1 [Paramacrobiotus metropolitanus]
MQPSVVSTNSRVKRPWPSELLVEIFQSLNSIDRTRCRRVCALWNRLLTTEAYFPDVRVSCRTDNYPLSWTNPLFWRLAGLLHCVNRHTKMIVLMHMNLGDSEHPGVVIRCTVGRIPTLVLYQCVWPHSSFHLEKTLYCHGSIMRICGMADRAVWSKCRIEEPLLTAVVSRHSHCCQPPEQLEWHLWDLFEQHIVLDEPVDRSILSEWIRQCVEHGLFEKLELALYDYQNADPRPSSQNGSRRWTASDMEDLDVNKLTPLAAAALFCLLEKEPPLPRNRKADSALSGILVNSDNGVFAFVLSNNL